MKNCCTRFRSELKTSMFSLEDDDASSKRRLDLKESFQMNKGVCSRVGIVKVILLLTTWAIFVHAVVTHPAPQFYPAFLTAWGLVFAICYQTGSLLLTASSCCSPTTADISNSRLVKFTWILYSISTVLGCVIALVFWAGRHAADQTRPVILVDVTVHGVVLLVILIQGLIVDHVPFRIKHSIVAVIFALFYLIWLLLQNLVIRYNPIDEEDDDAIYNTMNYREKLGEAIGNTVMVAFGFFPFFTILIWALSLRGRKYLSDDKEEKTNGADDSNSNTQQETHEFEDSSGIEAAEIGAYEA